MTMKMETRPEDGHATKSLSRRYAGHDHSSMSDMDDMDQGTITVEWFPQLYWIFVGSIIAAVTIGHVINILICQQRLRAARRLRNRPARPSRWPSQRLELVVALYREIANATLPRWTRLGLRTSTPTFGVTGLIIGNLALVIILCFYKLDPSVGDNYQNIAYRCGFLSLGQIPLLFLLAGKNNIIGAFTGHSYDRLNKIHRYASRTLLVTVTLHMGYWFADWAPYDYIGYQIKNDRHFTQTGLIAWAILVWIVFSSFAPIRNFSYELFYVQHVISFVAFMTMVFLHTPAEDHGWLWAGIAVFVFDRIVRCAYILYNNTALSRLKQRRQLGMQSLWACPAELSPLPDSMTRVTIHDPPVGWQAGQHAIISCYAIAPLQGHPFSIVSLPSDGRLEFMIKAQSGATRRLHDFAKRSYRNLPTAEKALYVQKTSIVLNGVYGNMRSLRQFDSVVLLSGSSGASFTVPLLRDLIEYWKGSDRYSTGVLRHFLDSSGVVTRHIRFVWVVRSGDQTTWFAEQLGRAIEDVKHLREQGSDVELQASIYVTCDDTFTAFHETNEAPRQASTHVIMTEEHTQTSGDSSQSGRGRTSAEELKRSRKVPEKQLHEAESTIFDVKEVDPRSGSELSPARTDTRTCGPDNTCCCRITIADEDADAVARDAVCSCNCVPNNSSDESSCVSIEEPATSLRPNPPRSSKGGLHPSTALLSGRPHLRTIIRRSLEQAQGESAVVVCGPRGMNEDARRAVVGLSDERAVGRGTGALGVWFWAEGFGW